MKSFIIVASLYISIVLLGSCSQEVNDDFEGYISYQHKYVSSNRLYNDSSERKYYGTHSYYYYKNGNYKWLSPNCYFLMDLHVHKNDFNYMLTNRSNTFYVKNSQTSNQKIIDYSIRNSQDTILGYLCKVLTVRTASLNKKSTFIWKRDFYFSDSIKMNSAFFRNRNYNSQNLISSKMNALPLKIVVYYPNYSIIWEATKVTRKKLDDSFFQIPTKVVLKEID